MRSQTLDCFWCRYPVLRKKATRDHLIPQWATLIIPDLPWADRYVWVCRKCNGAKGPLPPALYAQIRLSPDHLKRETRRWHEIVQSVSLPWHGNPQPTPDSELLAYIRDEMTKPLPAMFKLPWA